ncbi:MAG: hypothetical protein KKD69_02990, partial [Euryarchaeota archaeon]|nr:hypothetical protein [Euryarchaeota archaeon]
SRASGGRIHVNRQLTPCTRMPGALAYVDASSRGATLDVWLRHTWRYVSMHNGGHNADEKTL